MDVRRYRLSLAIVATVVIAILTMQPVTFAHASGVGDDETDKSEVNHGDVTNEVGHSEYIWRRKSAARYTDRENCWVGARTDGQSVLDRSRILGDNDQELRTAEVGLNDTSCSQDFVQVETRYEIIDIDESDPDWDFIRINLTTRMDRDSTILDAPGFFHYVVADGENSVIYESAPSSSFFENCSTYDLDSGQVLVNRESETEIESASESERSTVSDSDTVSNTRTGSISLNNSFSSNVDFLFPGVGLGLGSETEVGTTITNSTSSSRTRSRSDSAESTRGRSVALAEGVEARLLATASDEISTDCDFIQVENSLGQNRFEVSKFPKFEPDVVLQPDLISEGRQWTALQESLDSSVVVMYPSGRRPKLIVDSDVGPFTCSFSTEPPSEILGEGLDAICES